MYRHEDDREDVEMMTCDCGETHSPTLLLNYITADKLATEEASNNTARTLGARANPTAAQG